jgi:hypothetical protein
MRAIWSFWSKPFFTHRRYAWASEAHHLFAWVLSLETAKQHYPETYLYTDDTGADLLVERLGLQFTCVSTALNALAGHDPGWWSLGKLYAYRLQRSPFVHIDNDVFLWKRLPERVERANVFAQNPEPFTRGASHYQPERVEEALLRQSNGWLPQEWRWYMQWCQGQRGECCGIIGGTRPDFICHFADQAIQMVEHHSNDRGWSLLQNPFPHMIAIEQYFLAACVEYHRHHAASPYYGIAIEYLLAAITDLFRPDCAAHVGFTHLLGGVKRHPELAKRLERRVQRDYPGFYERCVELGRLL